MNNKIYLNPDSFIVNNFDVKQEYIQKKFYTKFLRQILNISSSIEEQDIDFLSYYINFLKTIANKLDKNTLSQLFYKENNSFPLLDEANSFFNFNDVMIKTQHGIFFYLLSN